MNGIHEVTGSIPVWSTILRFAQSADAVVLRQVGFALRAALPARSRMEFDLTVKGLLEPAQPYRFSTT